MKELNVDIGSRIRAYREGLGMTREAFSEQVGISPQFLAEAEKGSKGLSAESIYKLCKNGGMSADYLILGKLGAQELKTPLDFVLQDMPGEFAVQYANVLKAVNEAVLDAKRSAEEDNKRRY